MIALPIACSITGNRLIDGGTLLPDLAVAGIGLSLGPELLSNGGFDTDTIWAKGLGWTIASGVASVTTPGITSQLSQPLAFVAGAIYAMTIDITSITAGAIFVRAYTGASPAFSFGAVISLSGAYKRYITAPALADTFSIDGSSASIAVINSVSLKRVL